MTLIEIKPRVLDDDRAPVEFLRDLVAIPSVHPNEVAAVARFLDEARALGLDASTDAVGNAIAVKSGRAGAPVIALLGHIDVVPGLIPVRIENGELHGRGSVDAKGPLCAMLYAAARATTDATVHVIGAVGEESARSPGARAIVGAMHPDVCIIGEPSGWDGVTLGYKGRLIVRATLTRECGHSAGPHGSVADALMAWWMRVLPVIDSLQGAGTGAFDRIQSTVRRFTTESDGLADSGVLEAGFRLPIGCDPSALEESVRAVDHHDVVLAFDGHEGAVRSPRDDAVVAALSQSIRVHGGEPRHKVKTGTADMNVVAPVWKCAIAAYGPGDSGLDHTARERVNVDEYLRSIRILTGAVEQLGRMAARTSASTVASTH